MEIDMFIGMNWNSRFCLKKWLAITYFGYYFPTVMVFKAALGDEFGRVHL